MTKSTLNPLFTLFTLLLSLFVLSACGGGGGSSGANGDITTPTIGAKLTMALTNTQGQAISTTQATEAVFVSVVATDDFGRVESGVTVTFSTDLGAVSQDTALTDSNGKASIRLITTDTQIGVAALTATATVDTKALSISGQVEITAFIVTTATLNLSLLDETCTTAVNETMAGTTLCLKASIFEGTTPVPDQIVDFSTTQGALRPSSALTNEDGIATAFIDSSSSVLGATTITTTSGTLTITDNFEYTEVVVGTPTISIAVLDASCTAVTTAAVAGTTLCLRAILLEDGQPFANQIINYSTTLGILRQSSKLTNDNGIAEVLFDSTVDLLGAATATASFDSPVTISSTANFEYSAFVPSTQVLSISLVLLDQNCQGQVTTVVAGNTLCMKAGLFQNGLPIKDQIITFVAPLGALRQTTVLTDATGFAITYLDSTTALTGAATATVAFDTITAAQNYQFSPLSNGASATISLVMLDTNCSTTQNSLPAGSSYCLQAVLFKNNQPVVGEIINFDAQLGSLRPASALTNAAGVATVFLDSTTTMLGASIATASFDTVSSAQNYQFTDAVSQDGVHLTLQVLDADCTNPVSSATAGTALCLHGTLKQGATPLPDEVVAFVATIGTLQQTTALTNASGTVRVLIDSITSDLGASTATATYNEFVAGANYEFTRGDPQQETTLTLTVYDETCQTIATAATAGASLCLKAGLTQGTTPVPNEIVNFSASLGTLSPASALTDDGGFATVMLNSTNADIGAASATATYQAFTINQNYEFQVAQTSRTLSLAILADDCIQAASSFPAGASFCLAATLLDDTNAPIENEIITFTAPLGTLDQASSLTDSNGIATVIVSGTSALLGAATATATNSNLNGSANYEFVSDSSLPTQGPSLSMSSLQNGVEKNSFKVGESIQLQATLLNIENIDNIIVRFTAERGTLTTDSALSDASGLAQVTLTADATTLNIGAAVATAQITISGVTHAKSYNYEILSADAVELDSARIGHFDEQNAFVEGFIGIDLLPTNGVYQLSAGGTMGLNVVVVDQNDSLIISPTPVTFTSACAANGSTNLDAQVTTINGKARSTYEDVSCATVSGNQDILVATITVNNVALTATREIKLLPEAVGSIEFISAEPTSIVLQGTGGQGKQETSNLTFSVKGVLGNPLTQQPVTFSLDTTVGDLSLSPVSSQTNSQGLVTTKVTSGNVPAAVRVTASTITGVDINGDNIEIKTQSDLLSVNTGLPDQNSITLATTLINPEAHNWTGREATIRAFMADSFNNPVPDGTTVNFTTEGGFIEPSCNTINGHCSVLWTGVNPRVPNHRITVLATAIGHETFFDVNGNNVFDNSDGVALNQSTDSGLNRGNYAASGFVDHSEAWRDDDESRTHNSGEVFIDFNNDNTFNAADGKFNGPQCTHDSLCAGSTAKKINVRKAIVMIMSGSSPVYSLVSSAVLTGSFSHLAHIGERHVLASNDIENGINPVDGPIIVNATGTSGVIGSNIILDEGFALPMQLVVADDAAGLGQILPAGTAITISTSFGSVTGTTSFTVPNSVGYLNSDGTDQYGGSEVSFSLVNTNSTTTTGDTNQSGLITFSFVFPQLSSQATFSFTMPFTMLGN
jgi:hypothetical protein